MNYFSKCKNLDDAKAKYRELAKEHHPDKGGDTKTMQDINLQYAQAKNKFKNGTWHQDSQPQNDSGGFGGFAEWMEAFKRHQREQEAYKAEKEAKRKKAEYEAQKKREEDLRRQGENAKKEEFDLFSRYKQPYQSAKKTKDNASQIGLF